MGHRPQRPNWWPEQARSVEGPSPKPIFLVAGLFLAAVVGAVLTTGSPSGPVRPSGPGQPIVVSHVIRPAVHSVRRVSTGSGPTSVERWI